MTSDRKDDDLDLDAGLPFAFPETPSPRSETPPVDLGREPWVSRTDAHAATGWTTAHDELARQVARLEATGRYRVTGELGHGGNGVVLSARDDRLGREVAVKILNRVGDGDPASLERFVEEAQITGQLEHPAIVPVHDVGLLEGGSVFFTMKIVRGETLAERLEGRSDPTADLSRFLGYLARVAEAVAFAHDRGVVHRDLKPSNVMIGGFGEVQVMDWGLAKGLDRPASKDAPQPAGVKTLRALSPRLHSLAGTIQGTPAYMAPEQARGQVELIDARTDVFSLGGILCEILTGAAPYRRSDSEDAWKPAAEADLDDAWKRLAEAPIDAALTDLARACLAPEPAERPADAGEVAARLEGYLESVAERARRTELAGVRALARADHERRLRVRTVVLSAFVVLAVVVGVSVVLWTAAQREERERNDREQVSELYETAVRRSDDARRGAATDVEAWNLAVAAAAEAHAAARAGDAGERWVERTRRLVDATTGEQALAREQVRRRDLAARTIAELRELGRLNPRVAGLAEISRRYRAAFAGYGIELAGEADEAAAAALLRDSPIRDVALDALDDWCAALRPGGTTEPVDWRRLARVAAQADPDPERVALRAAALGDELAPLAELVARRRGVMRPVVAVALVAPALARLDSPAAAVALLRSVQARHPGDFRANHALGYWLSRLDPAPHDEAISFFRAALAIRPDEAVTRINLAVCLANAGRDAEARAELEWVTRKHPDMPGPYERLGYFCMRREDYDGARRAYEAALRLRPRNFRFLYGLACAEWNRGDPRRAEELALRAVEIEPRCVNAWDVISRIRRRRGDDDGAVAALDAAVEASPGHAASWLSLGEQLRRLGEVDEAIAALRRALELDGSSLRSRAALADALVAGRRPDEALELIHDYRAAHPEDEHGQMLLARALAGAGRHREALACLESITGVAHDVETLMAKVRSYLRLDDQIASVLAGETAPRDAEDWRTLTEHCRRTRHRLREARLWRRALSEPTGALPPGAWLNAARAAAAVVSGAGRDTDGLGPALRSEWAGLAMEWLGRAIEVNDAALASGALSMRRMAGWLESLTDDTAWAALRDGHASFGALAPGVRRTCGLLWDDVDARIDRLAGD